MLDTFEIVTTSGVVLWSRNYASVSPNIINSFIKDVFIEERTATGTTAQDLPAAEIPPYKKDQYTLKWTTAKDLELIFVVSLAPAVRFNQTSNGLIIQRPRQSTNLFCIYHG